MNRRRFLATLVSGTAAMVLDPELALWKPGAKTIFLPPKKAFAYTLADPPLGISIRMVREYDFTRDLSPVRFDVLYGIATLSPQLAAVVADETDDTFVMRPMIAASAKNLADRIDKQALDYAYSLMNLKLWA